MCRCGVRLDFGEAAAAEVEDGAAAPTASGEATCQACGAQYSLADGTVTQVTPGDTETGSTDPYNTDPGTAEAQ